MKLTDIVPTFDTDLNECEVVYFDNDGNELLDESAVRQFKLSNNKIVSSFRCLAGPKAGKLVSSPAACGVRKDPKKVAQGRKLMRQKGAIIVRKSLVSKSKAKSKQVARLNQRLTTV